MNFSKTSPAKTTHTPNKNSCTTICGMFILGIIPITREVRFRFWDSANMFNKPATTPARKSFNTDIGFTSENLFDLWVLKLSLFLFKNNNVSYEQKY